MPGFHLKAPSRPKKRDLAPWLGVFFGVFGGIGLAEAADPLRVVVAGSPPFVVSTGARGDLAPGGKTPAVAGGLAPAGLAVDLWHGVATEAGLPYIITATDDIAGALLRVKAGEADVAVGPISITAARTASVAFTQPYFRAQMGILARAQNHGLLDQVAPFLTLAFFVGAGSLLFILILVGHLIWVLERKANDQFPPGYLPGVGAGTWLALVTMTTVGYGDKAPITVAGRFVVGIWMIVAMISASSLTAGIATALTLSQLDRSDIESLADLERRRVAAVVGTTGGDLAKVAKARVAFSASIDAAIDELVDGHVDAVVADLPILEHQIRRSPRLPVRVIADNEHAESYGFALRHGDPLRIKLDIALLRLAESGRVKEITANWLAAP